MRVGVVGAGGRMGREVCRTVLDRPGLDLVAAVDPGCVGSTVADLVGTESPSSDPVTVAGDLEALTTAGVEVVVDFTHLEASRATLAFCAAAGNPCRGRYDRIRPADLDDLARMFATDGTDGTDGTTARTARTAPPDRPERRVRTASWPPTSPSARC